MLDVEIELFTLGEHLVQSVLAEHRAQRRLRELARRHHEILHFDDRLLRIDDAEIDDGVDLDRNVVARDHVLARHIEHDGAQFDAHHLLDERHKDDQSRTLDLPESAQLEDNAALVFAQNAQRRRDEYDDVYFDRFFAKSRPLLEKRLGETVTGVASLIAAAWEAAGRPALPLEAPARPPRKVRRTDR